MMEVVIKIPEEFESHFNNDKFKDSLNRIIFDIEQCNRHGAEYDAMSGNYELETLKMLKDAVLDGKQLPKGHGRLGDLDALEKYVIEKYSDGEQLAIDISDAPTIIEKQKGNKMGMIIYVNGLGAITRTDGNPLTQNQIKAIKGIEDGWGNKAFAVSKDGGGFEFNESMKEALDPYNEDVIKPLEALLDYAKANGMTLDADFDVTSECSDYDNINIAIKGTEITYGNSEIVNAATEELEKELQQRQSKRPGIRTTVLASENIPGDDFYGVLLELYSDKTETRSQLVDLARKAVAEFAMTEEGMYEYDRTEEHFNWGDIADCYDKPEFRGICDRLGLEIKWIHSFNEYNDVYLDLGEKLMEDLSVKVSGIEWDTDGEPEEELPEETVLNGITPDTDIADALSDEYGFCVESYSVDDVSPAK